MFRACLDNVKISERVPEPSDSSNKPQWVHGRCPERTFCLTQQIISRIPRPLHHEAQQTISSMKNFVDGQELRIQINMIEIEEAEPVPLQSFVKKYSIETRDEDSWEGHSLGNVEDWGWDHKGLTFHESLDHEFSSYLD